VVAASTLITESVPGQVRTTVQGLSDLVMGLVAALAGTLAGPVLQAWGYHTLAWLAGLLLIPATVSALTALSARPGHVVAAAAVE
jgi:predicted MFS family arabinose efflux permease